MKKAKRILSVLLAVFLLAGCLPMTASASPIGDDYPSEYKNVDQYTVTDKWGFSSLECTSFVAWRLNSQNGVKFTNQYMGASVWGYAKYWADVARNCGITVDNNPAVGAVAWWGGGTDGHVAWVCDVVGNNVTIEEYNAWPNEYAYQSRTLSKDEVDAFIHIKDISASGGTQEELEEFLTSFAWWDGTTFDSKSAKNLIVDNCNFLESLLHPASCFCYDDDLYPGEKRQIFENGEKDPLGKFWGMYLKVRVDRIDWILENIFNIPHKDLKGMREKMLAEAANQVYELGGYYYHFWGGVGGGSTAEIIETQQKNNLTLVYYRLKGLMPNAKWQYAYAVMEKKVIDGNTYWTLHYNTALSDGRNPLSSGGFIDIPTNSYYTSSVKWASDNNVVAGTSDTTFSPDQKCTRGQIVSFLWRAAGRPEPETAVNPFTDVKSSEYYYKAVLWAYENNIVAGTGATTFSPNQNCTRGQIVSFLWRSAGRPGPKTTVNPFSDAESGEYYYNAVLWAHENKIVAGTSDTTFSPNQSCTRAQAVTFMYRNLAA